MSSSNCLSHFIFLIIVHCHCIGFAKADDGDNDWKYSKLEYGLVHIQTLDGRFLDTYKDANTNETFVITADPQVTTSQVWRIEKVNGYDDGRFFIYPFNDLERVVGVRNGEAKENDTLVLHPHKNEENQQFVINAGHIRSIKNLHMILMAQNGQKDAKQENKVYFKPMSDDIQVWRIIPIQKEYFEITKTKIFPSESVVLQNGDKYMDFHFDVHIKKYVVVASKMLSPHPSSLSQIWTMEKSDDAKQKWFFKSNHNGKFLTSSSVILSSGTRLEMNTLEANSGKVPHLNQTFYYNGGMIKAGNGTDLVLTVKKTSANHQTYDIVLQNNAGRADQIWSILKASDSASREITAVDSERKDDGGRICPDVRFPKLPYGLVNIKTVDGKYLDTFFDESESKTFLVAAEKSATKSQIWRIQKRDWNHMMIFPFHNHSEAVEVENINVNENDKLILWPVHEKETQKFLYEEGMLKSAKNRNMILTAPTSSGNDKSNMKIFLKDINKQCNQKWKIVPVEDSYLGLIDEEDDLMKKPVVIKNAIGYYLDVKYSFDDRMYHVVANGNIRKAGPLWKIEKTVDNYQVYKRIGTNQVLNDSSRHGASGTNLAIWNRNALMKQTFLYDRGMIKSDANNLTALTIGDDYHVDRRSSNIMFQYKTGHLSQMWSIMDAEAEYGSASAVQDEVSEIKITAFQAALIIEGENSALEFKSRTNKKAVLTTYHDQQLIDMSDNSKESNIIRKLESGLYKFAIEKHAILFKIDNNDIKSLPIKKLTFYADINGRIFEIKYESQEKAFVGIHCTQNRKTMEMANSDTSRFEGTIEAKNVFKCQIEGKTLQFSFQVLTMKPEIESFTYTYAPNSKSSKLQCSAVDNLASQAKQTISLYYDGLLVSESESPLLIYPHNNATEPGTYKCVVSNEHGMDETSLKVMKNVQDDKFGDDGGVLTFKAKPYSKSTETISTFDRDQKFLCKQGSEQMISTKSIQKEEAISRFYGSIHTKNDIRCSSKADDCIEFKVFV